MSAAVDFARRVAHRMLRPFKAVLKPVLVYVIRRLSTRFAADFVPLEDLARRVAEIAARQDRQEGFHWDHAALAKRLAAVEDQLEKLLQQSAPPEERPATDEAAGALSLIRFAPDSPPASTPLAHERQYRWDRAG